MISEIIYQLPLQNLKRVGDKFNFRSNDSCNDGDQRNRQHRGWFYKKDGIWKFKCFNCGNCLNFTTYIKNYFPEFYLDYFKKSFKKDKDFVKLEVDKKLKDELKLYSKFPLITIKNLDETHKAYQYIKNRKIPEDKLNLLYYSSDFTRFVNNFLNNRYSEWSFHDSRIVVPHFSKSGDVINVLQGRSLEKNSKMRYITLKIVEDSIKIFGLERIDYSKKIIAVEGAFDSLFIDNCVAFSGSDLSIENILKCGFSRDQIIIAYDNEKKNKEIKNKIIRFVESGFNVCCWPKEFVKYGKDINEMVLNGVDSTHINSVILNNGFSGKEGKLRFNMWYKV